MHSAPPQGDLLAEIARYWNQHIHDLEIASQPVGTSGFFQELDAYRYEKLDYLPRVVDFAGLRGMQLLEVGCGVGTDLIRMARMGARVTGVEIAEVAIQLARQNFAQNDLPAKLCLMNGERLAFQDNSFDVVYAHGVLQYTADPQRMVDEIHRVLRPGGKAVLMVYNRYSWLNAMSKVTKVGLEHEDAPVLRKYSIGEFSRLLCSFDRREIIPERFPVKSRLHGGWKGMLYNQVFVSSFAQLPRSWVRPLGWHLVGIGHKASASAHAASRQ